MAGRPPKKSATENQLNQDNILQKENQELKSQLEEMRKMMESLMASQKNVTSIPQPEQELEEIPEIPMHKTVKVMSLFSGGLNLKTSNDSSAQVFRFEYIGQTIPIMYSDLVKILSLQRNFFKEGYCMILDKNVIKAHYLEENYKNFIDGKTINNILTYDNDKIKEIFSSTTRVIQQSIVDLIIGKINQEGENIDINKIRTISDTYGKDIYELAIKMR